MVTVPKRTDLPDYPGQYLCILEEDNSPSTYAIVPFDLEWLTLGQGERVIGWIELEALDG